MPTVAPASSNISLSATGVEAVVPMLPLPCPDEPEPLPAVPGYTVVRELGRGAMGVVYEAIDDALNRPVALKLLADTVGGNAAVRARFGDEAEAVARLHHPNVVQIYRVGEHRGRPFLVLELVRGGSLADLLKGGPLDPPEAIDLLRAIARAVQHAHDHGVVHRDLKPGNVLISERGIRNAESKSKTETETGSPAVDSAFRIPHSALVPKVSDFGLAKLTDSDRGRTRSGMFLGTLGYVAPEVIDTPASASAASDVYGLGVMLFECVTGQLPIVGETFLDTVNRILQQEPEPPSAFRPGLPAGLDRVCRRALAKRPADRYPSAAAMAADLDRLAAGRRVRRGWRAWKAAGRAAVVFAAVIGCTAGAYFSLRFRDGATAALDANSLIAAGEFAQAEAVAARGLGRVSGLPGTADLGGRLAQAGRSARRGRLAGELHAVIDRLRFGIEPDAVTDAARRELVRVCDALWAARGQLLAEGAPLPPTVEDVLRRDLLDLALLSAELHGHDDAATAAARLREAEPLFGSPPALVRIRTAYETGRPLPASADGLSAWEVLAVGRFYLSRGEADTATKFLHEAVKREPGAFWPNFHLAQAALRFGRPVEAVAGFTTCLSAARDRRALCHYNRAVAFEATGEPDAALRDLDVALELEPDLARAAFRRGVVQYRQGQFAAAVADLDRARRLGHPPAAAGYHLALAYNAAGDARAAVETAADAQRHAPRDARLTQLIHDLKTDPASVRPKPTPRRSP